MNNLKDLFCHQLKLLYCVENRTIQYFPLIIKKTSDFKLRYALEVHLKETETHKKRLDHICKSINFDKNNAECLAITGLLDQVKEFMNRANNDNVFNAGLIAEIQRVEHFEICAYGTAVCYAKELGLQRIAGDLQETLNEEYNANDKLSLLAQVFINYKAVDCA